MLQLKGYTTSAMLHDGATLVCRAVDEAAGRPVILKTLRAGTRPQWAARLRQESAVLAELDVPGVVKPLALLEHEQRPVLVLEDIGGESLRTLASAGACPLETFFPIALTLAEALDHVHRRRIVHRDINPGNIVWNRATGAVQLIDFGLASRLPREQAGLIAPEKLEGTLAYLAPEQTGRMNRAVDYRADFYALGVTFYELLAGGKPFEAKDALEWVHFHIAREPQPLIQRQPAIPPALSDLVAKLMAKLPEERYQSGGGLRADLEECARQWLATGTIAPLALGQHDFSEQFQLPQKLYGREKEVASLLAAFQRVAAGGSAELVLVAGYSGIGKSVLVAEMHRSIVAAHGYFLSGKFDQYQRGVPYSTLPATFRPLLQQVLAGSAQEVAARRERLLAAMEGIGKVLIEFLPQVELLIGPQPEVPELPPEQAQTRAQMVFQKFIGVFAEADHPLVLFLDDLQWIDAGSRALFNGLLADSDLRHVLLVGAYRDHELASSPFLRKFLEEAGQSETPVTTLTLAPLTPGHLAQILAETLRHTAEEVEPLARLVAAKTGGNPFFAFQFLIALHQDRLLTYEASARQWRWNLEEIQARKFTDNIVEFMLGELRALPEITRLAMNRAAFLGAEFELRMLALVGEWTEAETEAALWPALSADLLGRQERGFRFPHDRVQEAAYALTPESERASTHVRIGRLLRDHCSAEEMDEEIFSVVGHLNQGASLLTEPAERRQLAELNLRAGRRARVATAYATAADYFASGAALLPPEAWENDYTLAFALHLQQAQCELGAGRMEGVPGLITELLRQARGPADRMRGHAVNVDFQCRLGAMAPMQQSFLAIFREAGIELPFPPTAETIQQGYIIIRTELGERSIESLADLPPMTDPTFCALMEVMLSANAAFRDQLIMIACLPDLFRIAMRYGSAAWTPSTLASVGMILALVYQQGSDGFRFSRVAIEMVEARRVSEHRGPVLITAGICASFSRPIAEAVQLLERSIQACYLEGAHARVCEAGITLIYNLFLMGSPLEEIAQRIPEFEQLARQQNSFDLGDLLKPITQFLRAWQGQTPALDRFDEAAFVAALTPERWGMVGGTYWHCKMLDRYFAGDYAGARAAVAAFEPYREPMSPSAVVPETLTFHLLALSAEGPANVAALSARELASLPAVHAELQRRAQQNPAAVAGRLALAEAEIARMNGDTVGAMRGYEAALAHAREYEMRQIEALTHECAARFYREQRFPTSAEAHLRAARAAYQRWGATAKVCQLEESFPSLRAGVSSAVEITQTTASTQTEIDLLAVVKATQAISGEIVRDQLLHTLLEVVLQQSGAQFGALLLAQGETLACAATARVEGSEVTVDYSAVAEKAELPEMLPSYVRRTRELVLLEDARTRHPFEADPYLATHRPAAVLCLPILRQSTLVGVVYLEHRTTAGVFTRSRLAVLEPLAAQAAISLENAHLFALTQRNETKLRQQADRLELLSDIDRGILAASSIKDTTTAVLQRVSALIPAQMVSIILFDYERQETWSFEMREGSAEPTLRHFPVLLDNPEKEPNLEVTNLEDVRQFPQQTDIMRQLAAEGVRSILSAPLVVEGRIEGRLSFLSPEIGAFDHDDAEIAREVTAQLTIAVRQRQLHEQTRRHASELEQRVKERTAELQAANQELESFSYSISHDLRAPLRAIDWYSGKISGQIHERFDEKGQQQFGIICEETRRMGQLIDDLLAFSKLGRTALRIVPIDMNIMATEVFEAVMREQDRERVEWHLGNLPEAVGDHALLRQVWVNLLANAVKYSGKKARAVIEVTGERIDGAVRYRVRDNGAGFDLNYAQKLFGVFQRMHDQEEFTGTGVGLAIVQRIIHRHGGTITADSAVDHGATFTFTLPG